MGELTLQWGVAERPKPGETESGDLHVVLTLPDGLLVAVLDAAGHGTEAARTAQLARALLERHAGRSLAEVFRACHQGLLKSRGMVMLLACCRPAEAKLSWLGVGNVAGLKMTRAGHQEALLSQAGIVGYQLPEPLRERELTLAAGDLVVLATDGVKHLDELLPLRPDEPERAAAGILARAPEARDDSLVLVVRVG